MRKIILRSIVVSGVVAAMVSLALAADPPTTLPPPKPVEEPRKLRTELEALAIERESATKDLVDPSTFAADRAKLRGQLTDLIKKIGEKKMAPATAPHTAPKGHESPAMPPPTPPKFVFDENTKAPDALRAAMNLYRIGEIDAALRTFRQIDPNTLAKEDRAFVNYMSATCLRKTGKLNEAADLYREVADKRDDAFIASSASTQIATMKSIQQFESDLEQLRSKRKSK